MGSESGSRSILSCTVVGESVETGKRFVRGVVFHTGPRAYELDERILAAPIATLWV